jgi:hypothetical protein
MGEGLAEKRRLSAAGRHTHPEIAVKDRAEW